MSADFDATEKMLAHFIRKTHQLIPPGSVHGADWRADRITPVERRAVKDSAYRAKARRCTGRRADGRGVGAGLPIADAAGNMIIDIGGGTPTSRSSR